MNTSERIFTNLFALLAATQSLVDGAPSGQPAFVTSGRKAPQVSNVASALQPALYVLEGEQDIAEKAIALAKYEWHAAVVVFFRNMQGDTGIPSTQMNDLRDAVVFQLQQRTLATDGVTVVPLPGGSRQTLGGVVYHARLKGRIVMNEGLLNNQGALIFPVSILSPM